MNPDTKPTFWQRIYMIIKITLTTLILIALIAGLAWGGFLIFQELQRSFDSVTTRMNINTESIDRLRRDVDALKTDNVTQDGEVDGLQTEIDEMDTRLSEVQASLTADLSHQAELLAAMEENMAAAISVGETATEDTAALGTALVALQGDLNDTNGRIDQLGGEIDGLRAENETLNSNMTELEQAANSATEAAASLGDMQQTLSLFHVWELIARARLRLVEGNVGLATADVDTALRAMDVLVADSAETDTEMLQSVQARLVLTLANLEDDTAVAARDLETAWDGLDALLTARLFPEVSIEKAEAAETPTAEETEEAVPEPTPTPAPSS